MGGGVVKNNHIFRDVIYGRPLNKNFFFQVFPPHRSTSRLPQRSRDRNFRHEFRNPSQFRRFPD
jgi:hypothetical protein